MHTGSVVSIVAKNSAVMKAILLTGKQLPKVWRSVLLL